VPIVAAAEKSSKIVKGATLKVFDADLLAFARG
jgi:hypothetical protein